MLVASLVVNFHWAAIVEPIVALTPLRRGCCDVLARSLLLGVSQSKVSLQPYFGKFTIAFSASRSSAETRLTSMVISVMSVASVTTHLKYSCRWFSARGGCCSPLFYVPSPEEEKMGDFSLSGKEYELVPIIHLAILLGATVVSQWSSTLALKILPVQLKINKFNLFKPHSQPLHLGHLWQTFQGWRGCRAECKLCKVSHIYRVQWTQMSEISQKLPFASDFHTCTQPCR